MNPEKVQQYLNDATDWAVAFAPKVLMAIVAVSYTHLTLPTILLV